MTQYSIILATYNEKANITPMLDRLLDLMADRDFEIIVVDDNSPDGTWQIVAQRGLTDPRIKLLHRTKERGLASAYNAGIRAARGAMLAWLDCDFQHPPEKLLELFAMLDSGYDLASASRFLGNAACDARLTTPPSLIVRIHGMLSRLLSRMTSWVARSRLTDWSSGMLAARREVFAKQELEGEHGDYYMLLLNRTDKMGYRIKEIPYVLANRRDGESKTSTSWLQIFTLGLGYLRSLRRLINDPYLKNIR